MNIYFFSRTFCFLMVSLVPLICASQKKWDGGAGDQSWTSEANWAPDGIPVPEDDVVLDDSFVNGGYTVVLPSGPATINIRSILILSPADNQIMLELPVTNTAAPGLVISGDGIGLEIGQGGILRNSSGAASGDAIRVDHGWKIANGGRYIHHTSRGNANLINQLINDAGSEEGIFEFDVPGSAGYTVSLTGNTFGTLVFSASAGSKSYNGSGISMLNIRGSLIVNAGATVTSSMTAEIIVHKDLHIEGTLQLHPVSSGTTNRNLRFTGNPFNISGKGGISINGNFNKLICNPGSDGTLSKNLQLNNTANGLMISAGASFHFGNSKVTGNGSFIAEAGATLFFESPVAMQSGSVDASVNTNTIQISDGIICHFNGVVSQQTGPGFPQKIQTLFLEKSGGNLHLSQPLEVTDQLYLNQGLIISNTEQPLILNEASIHSPANQFGFSNQGWELSFVDGPVVIQTNGTGEFVAPVGKDGIFAPMVLNKTQSSAVAFAIEYFPSASPVLSPVNIATLHHISTQEYWSIQSSDPSSSAATVSLSWRPTSLVSAAETERQALRVAHFTDQGNGMQWTAAGNNPSIAGSDMFGFVNPDIAVPASGMFTLASASAFNSLPFREIVVKTIVSEKGIQIFWNVNDADNIARFQVEKSADGRIFLKEHSMNVLNNDRSRKFTFTDQQPFEGKNYYRIGVKLNSDSLVYSNVVVADFKMVSRARIYPNPADKEIILFFPTPSSNARCKIVRSNGSIISKEITISGNITRIPIAGLAGGYYSLIVQNKDELIALPFLKY